MKKSILLATSAFLAAGLVAVDAKAADVELYGQVNKSVVYFDDGVNEKFSVVDNDYSSTRFGLRGSKAINHGLTASFLIEGEVQSNASNALGVDASGKVVETTGEWVERHTRIGVAGNWGALFVGKTSTATDGVTEIDLAPAGDVTGSGQDRISVAGTELFIDNMDGIALGHDGDRVNTVRFDSPIFNGVQARVAYAPSAGYDVALFYNGKVAGLETAAGIGYVKPVDQVAGDGKIRDQISGSVSVRHDSGLAATLAGGYRDGVDGTDGRFGYAKVGYAWGAYGVAAEYGLYTDARGAFTTSVGGAPQRISTGNGVEVWGIAAQRDLGNGVSTAAFYRNFDADLAEHKVDMVGVNLRVKF